MFSLGEDPLPVTIAFPEWTIALTITAIVVWSRCSAQAVPYLCMVTQITRVRINRVRLPILLVVSLTGKVNISLSPFALKNSVLRDKFDCPVPRQPAHYPYSGRIWCLLTGLFRLPRWRPHTSTTATRHRASSEFIGSRNCAPMAFTAESPPAQGQLSYCMVYWL